MSAADPISVQIGQALADWINQPEQNWGFNVCARQRWGQEKDLEDDCLSCEIFPTAIPQSNSITRLEDEDDYTVWLIAEQGYKRNGLAPDAWVNARIGLIETIFQRSKNMQLDIAAGRTVIAASSNVETLVDLEDLEQSGLFRASIQYTFRDYRPGDA